MPMLARFVEIVQTQQPERVVELGIAHGGSTALISMLTIPEKLVAIDFDETPRDALTSFIAQRDLDDRVRLYLGVDQADIETLHCILDREFDEEGLLDLVIDDASHLFNESRTSFNALFPLLRTGGTYLIEDWAWAHFVGGGELAEKFESWPTGVPLTALLVELAMACATRNDVVSEVVVDSGFIQVRRGPARLEPSTFDIAHYYIEGPTKLLPPFGAEARERSR